MMTKEDMLDKAGRKFVVSKMQSMNCDGYLCDADADMIARMAFTCDQLEAERDANIAIKQNMFCQIETLMDERDSARADVAELRRVNAILVADVERLESLCDAR